MGYAEGEDCVVMTQDGSERRKYPRIGTTVRVTLTFPDVSSNTRKFMVAHSKNLSRSGVLISTPVPPSEGSFVIAKFEVPGEPKAADLFAKVIRVEPSEKGNYDVALIFTNSSKESLEKIKRFLEEEAL